MNAAFLDSGFLIALESSGDQNHRTAADYWSSHRGHPAVFVTTSFVLDEVLTWFNNRGHHAKAVQVGEWILQSRLVELVQIDEALLQEAWAYFRRHADKRYSFTDCVSFIVMRQRGISTALSFDHHFEQAGFQIAPTP